MKVLLTGATGFLGQAVARAVHAGGHDVRVLVRSESVRRGLPEDAECVPGDVTDGDSLMRAAEGCEAVLHMAALVKVWLPDPERFEAVNVGGLRNALQASRAAGARLVYTSSFMAVGPTSERPADEAQRHPGDRFRNPYERTKAMADSVAMEAGAAGQDVVIVYPGVIYGPGEMTEGNIVVRMIADLAQGRMPGIIGPGDRLWSYAFVEDVAAGHVGALLRGRSGERYFLCGENVSMNALFKLVQELGGPQAPHRHIPYAVASALGSLLFAWAELTGHPPLLTHEVVNVFREHWAYDSSKAAREIGYAQTPLREGLRRTLSWMQETGVA